MYLLLFELTQWYIKKRLLSFPLCQDIYNYIIMNFSPFGISFSLLFPPSLPNRSQCSMVTKHAHYLWLFMPPSTCFWLLFIYFFSLLHQQIYCGFLQDHLLKEGMAWLDTQAPGEPQYWLPALFTELYSQEITPEEAKEALPWQYQRWVITEHLLIVNLVTLNGSYYFGS